MAQVCLVFFSLSLAASLKVGLIIPSEELANAKKSQAHTNLEIVFYLTESWSLYPEGERLGDSTDIIIAYDLSESEHVSYQVKLESERAGILHLLAWSESTAANFQAIYPHLSRQNETEAIIKVLKRLGIAEINMISTGIDLLDDLGEAFSVEEFILVVPQTSQNSLDKIASRTFKPSGIRSAIIDLPANLTSNFLSSLKKAKVFKEGFSYLSTRTSSWITTSKEFIGLLLLSEEGLETADTWLESELKNLNWLTSGNTFQRNSALAEVISLKLSQRSFSLLNIQIDGKVKIGSCLRGIVNFDLKVLYPGNVETFDPTLLTKILVTLNSSPINADGSIDNQNRGIFIGAYSALSTIQESKFLGRFEIQPKETSCSASVYNKEFSKMCVRGGLGVAHIGTYSTSSVLSTLDAQAELGDKTPVIGPQIGTSSLSNKLKYPFFIRNRVSSKGYVPALVQFLRKLKYDKVMAFYSNEGFGKDLQSLFSSALKQANIEVVTAEQYQLVDLNFTQNATATENVINSIKSSEIRPMLVLMTSSLRLKFIEFIALSDFQGVDVLCLYLTSMSEAWLLGSNEIIDQRMKIVLGSIFITHSGFLGEAGERAKADVLARYNVAGTVPICQYYDGSFMIAYALKEMILRGKDFEDHYIANTFLREVSFYGCSGKVTIDSDTNDRRDQDMSIYNVQQNEDGQYFDSLSLVISLTSIQIFTNYDPIIWPDGTINVPDLYLYNYKDCPFPEEYRHDFADGEDLASYLSLAYFILTVLLLNFMFTRRFFTNKISLLVQPVQVTFQDKLVLALVVLDLLQYIGHGPVFRNGEDVLGPVFDYASGGTLEAIKFKKGVYWKVLNSFLIIILGWSVMCLCIWLKFKGFDLKYLKGLTELSEASMPLLGNAIFLPVISVLFDVFICEEAHGVDKASLNYKDSFMYRDCNEDCWSGIHIRYAIVAAIALLVYLPVTVLSRPVWQELVDVNLFTRPTFFLQKSFVEVSIVMLRRGLRKRNELAHAICYLLLILLHLALTMLRIPFNYARLNMWFYLSMSFVAIFAVLNLLQLTLNGLSVAMALSLLFAIGILQICSGLIIQWRYFPSMLISKQEQDLQEIFRFAFNLRNVKPPSSLLKNKEKI